MNKPKAQRKPKARGKGHGTLVKRGAGYMGRWMVNGVMHSRMLRDEEGNLITVKEDAKKALSKLTEPFRLENKEDTIEQLKREVEGVEAEKRAYYDSLPALAVKDGFTAWLAFDRHAQEDSERTIDGYRAYWDNITLWLKKNRPEVNELRQITAADAQAWADWFLGKFSAGTYNKYLSVLRCIFNAFIEHERKTPEPIAGVDVNGPLRARLKCNPFAGLDFRKHDQFTRRELTVGELQKIQSSATGEMRTLVAVGIYTGLRMGDCALLRWESVDLARGFVTLVPAKTRKSSGRSVKVAIHPVLMEMLKVIPNAHDGYVMPEIAAMYNHRPGLICTRMKLLFKSCGIETNSKDPKTGRERVEIGFHSLRHSFVSICENAGVPAAHVQSIVGHSSPAMTRHYYHTDEDALKRAISAIPDISAQKNATETADAGEGRFSSFCKMWDSMTEDERDKAREYIGSK